ncbi:MAG: hypothetical protein SPL99_10395 [Catonella sp.]|nr:hypothetical protein [Catonella sp.]MDY6357066.1 hypothetical protein [Catonella sp.]
MITVKDEDLRKINGGALCGAIGGAILGGAAGLAVYSGRIATGTKPTLAGIYHAYVAGASFGGGIGAITPV